ncbi:MAG TPA: hypothetical protein VEI57_15740 [Nitrospirota bacterium]|nr:hypothetical protein [Nitrospirota bacterium]
MSSQVEKKRFSVVQDKAAIADRPEHVLDPLSSPFPVFGLV